MNEATSRVRTCLPHPRGRRRSSRPARGGWSGGEQGAALASARPHIDAPPPELRPCHPRIHPPLCSSVGLEREGGGGRTGRRGELDPPRPVSARNCAPPLRPPRRCLTRGRRRRPSLLGRNPRGSNSSARFWRTGPTRICCEYSISERHQPPPFSIQTLEKKVRSDLVGAIH